MFTTRNGWTVARMKEAIQTRNLGRPAYGRGARCTYLAPDGNRCAVGVFIPDGHASIVGDVAEMDARDLLTTFPDLAEHMPIDEDGLMLMQNVHDICPHGVDPRPRLLAWIAEYVRDSSVAAGGGEGEP